jgi:hypothetical protein
MASCECDTELFGGLDYINIGLIYAENLDRTDRLPSTSRRSWIDFQSLL